MKKFCKSVSVLCAGALLLASCGKADFSKQISIMEKALTTKYKEEFHVIDIATRPTSDLNSQGDVYYAYATCDSDERRGSRGFYCELNADMTIVEDYYMNACLQPAIESRFNGLIEGDKTIVALASTEGDEIFTKYTYKNVVGNNIPFTIVVIIPADADNLATFSGETENERFTRMYKELSNSSSNVSATIVYCDTEYVETYKAYVNHLLPFDYKVDYKKIYADVSLSVERGDLDAQFITQLNNDLVRYKK